MSRLVAVLVLALCAAATALADQDLGNLSANPYDPRSVANPFGAGSPYRADSPTNPYGRGWRIVGE